MFRIIFISSLLIGCLIYFFPVNVDAKVLGYWPFDDKGDLGEDVSGLGNHGEPKNGAIHTAQGRVRGGMRNLEGTWLEVPHHDSLNVNTGQITLMCWVIFDPFEESTESSLIYKNGPFILEGAQKDRRFWTSYSLFKYRERKKAGSFAFEANMTEGRGLTAPGFERQPDANKWYHVAGVADGTKIRLYVNGKEEVTADQKGEFKPSEQPLTIGYDLRIDPALGGAKPYLIGVIDEAIVIDKALTQAQIKEAIKLGESGKGLDTFDEIFAVEPAGKLTTKWGEIKAQR